MEQYGFSERERSTYAQTRLAGSKKRFTITLYIAAIAWVLSLLIYVFVEPNIQDIATFLATPAHAQVRDQTDREQETKYCTAWNESQMRVTNADNMDVAKHCADYL